MKNLYHLSPVSDLTALKPNWGRNPDGTIDEFAGVYLCTAEFVEYWRVALAVARGENLHLYEVTLPPARPSVALPYPGYFDRAEGREWQGDPSPEIVFQLGELPCKKV